MKLATQDKPFFPASLPEKFRTVRSLGFDGFEIDGSVLVEQFHEVKSASASAQLPVVTACGGYRGWIGDFEQERRKQAVEDIGEILKRVSELGGTGIVVPAAWGMFSKRLPPMTPPRTESEDREVLLESLVRLDRAAAATGTYIYLEPLNRYEDHMLNRLSDAVQLIQAGSFSRVRVTADFYHMNIEEPKIDQSIVEAGPYIGHVHLADSHRFQPGDGHLDFRSGFEALRQVGYEGWMAFECRVTGEPEMDVYRRSLQFIRKLI